MSTDQPPPGYQLISVEQLDRKLGIHTPVLKRSIAGEAKVFVCSINVSQTDGFLFFFLFSLMQGSLYGVCLGTSRTAVY